MILLSDIWLSSFGGGFPFGDDFYGGGRGDYDND